MSKAFKKWMALTKHPEKLNTNVVMHVAWTPIFERVNAILREWADWHHHDPFAAFDKLEDRLRRCVGDANLNIEETESSSPAVPRVPLEIVGELETVDGESWDWVNPESEAWLEEWKRTTRAVQHNAFADIRVRFARPSLYTNHPKRHRSAYAQGRSGDAEMKETDYKKIYAVSLFIWRYIQGDEFRQRHAAQPPPKSFLDSGEFGKWLFGKLKNHLDIQTQPEARLWSTTWTILREAWASKGVGFPSCGWTGWHFSEAEFCRLEIATQNAFEDGFGVIQ